MDSDIDRAPVTEALTWPDRANALAIRSAETYGAAAELLKAIKALRQKIADTFGPHVKRAFDAHRALVAEQRSAEEPLTLAERTIKDKLGAYDQAQERIRRDEQARLEALARQQAEERQLADALAAEAAGDTVEAEAIINEAPAPVVVQVEKAVPKVAGISYRTTYSARVTDKHALIAFVAANPQFENLIDPNMPALNGQARSLKMAMQIPGVVVDEKRDIAAGAGR